MLTFAGSKRFQLIRVLGGGGMGIVYEAIDGERKSKVALKTLKHLSAEALLRFKTEFRALQDIRHENLVGLGELLEEEGSWFYTMELVEGVHFASWVRTAAAPPHKTDAPTVTFANGTDSQAGGGAMLQSEQGDARERPRLMPPSPRRAPRFDEARLRGALAQLAQGLHALHQAGKVHRDVKPSNVLVTPAGRVVIIDFGLIAEAERRDLRDTVVGTVPFMAPEQSEARPVDAAADWYSVGVMLYQALTGDLPHFGNTKEEILEAKRTRDPPPPRDRVYGVPDDLNDLCVSLLERDPARRPSGAEVLHALSAVEPSDDGAAVAPVFVGRQRELFALGEAYGDARAGAAVTVVVHGESGVGKSTLVKRFLAELVPHGAMVLAGRCYERESVPYKAVDEAIDDLARHLSRLPPEEVRDFLPRGMPLLLAAFPVLREVRGVPPVEVPAGSAQERRAQIFAAVRELFARLCARGPVVLVIDDLQWADADSLAMLAELVRPPEAPALLLLCTTRDLRRVPVGARRIEVGPLPAADARELADKLGAADVEALVAESGGHPLFLDALVRHHAHGDGGAPVRLDEALWARAARLPPRARELLEVVALAGAPIEQGTAARAAGLDLGELDGVTAALRTGHLARTSGPHAVDRIEAYHDRVREAVTARLDGEARRKLHERLARALADQPDVDPEALAIHWRGAGDALEARRWAEVAGDQARQVFAFDHAAELYATALELGGGEGLPLRVKLAETLADAGRGLEAGDAFLAAASLAAAAPDDQGGALDLRRRAAEQLLRSGQIDRGSDAMREVLAGVGLGFPATPARMLASLLLHRAQLRLRGFEWDENDARRMTRADAVRMNVCYSAATGLAMVNSLAGADFQAQSTLFSLRSGDPYHVALGLAQEAAFTSTGGIPASRRAWKLHRRAEELARRIDDGHALGTALMTQAMSKYLETRWADAAALGRQAEQQLVERAPQAQWELQIAHFAYLASVWFLGDLRELYRCLSGYLARAVATGNVYAATTWRSGFFLNGWLMREDVAGARQAIEDSLREWTPRGFDIPHLFNVYNRAHLMLYAGEAGAHAHILGSWKAIRRSLLLSTHILRFHLYELRGRAAVTAGDAADALASARVLRKLGMPASLPMARMIESGAAAILGDRQLAAVRAAQAAEGFGAAGMKLYQQIARRRRGELAANPDPVEEANAWMLREGVADPDRACDLFAPNPQM